MSTNRKFTFNIIGNPRSCHLVQGADKNLLCIPEGSVEPMWEISAARNHPAADILNLALEVHAYLRGYASLRASDALSVKELATVCYYVSVISETLRVVSDT